MPEIFTFVSLANETSHVEIPETLRSADFLDNDDTELFIALKGEPVSEDILAKAVEDCFKAGLAKRRPKRSHNARAWARCKQVQAHIEMAQNNT